MFRLPVVPLLVTAVTFLNSCSSAPTATATIAGDFSTRKDVVFTTENWAAPLLADFYQPDSRKPTPAVLLVHGGGWTGKERRSDMAGIAKSLAKRGYFVMNTTYRLTPEWKFPSQREDLEEALGYLRRNSKELNIDGKRIATFGYSAGGHLAALVGLARIDHQ